MSKIRKDNKVVKGRGGDQVRDEKEEKEDGDS